MLLHTTTDDDSDSRQWPSAVPLTLFQLYSKLDSLPENDRALRHCSRSKDSSLARLCSYGSGKKGPNLPSEYALVRCHNNSSGAPSAQMLVDIDFSIVYLYDYAEIVARMTS